MSGTSVWTPVHRGRVPKDVRNLGMDVSSGKAPRMSGTSVWTFVQVRRQVCPGDRDGLVFTESGPVGRLIPVVRAGPGAARGRGAHPGGGSRPGDGRGAAAGRGA